MAKSFRDLDVWKMSIDLTAAIYELTADYPRSEVYALSSQMRRAAISVASNIAEGSSRGTHKDFRQFVKMAAGSNSELQTQLVISRRLGFGEKHKCDKAETLSHDVSRMLSGLSKYLTTKIRTKAQQTTDNK